MITRARNPKYVLPVIPWKKVHFVLDVKVILLSAWLSPNIFYVEHLSQKPGVYMLKDEHFFQLNIFEWKAATACIVR